MNFVKGRVLKRKLQIFISSTYTDLKDDRQAAVGAILKAGHIPAGMELFTAGDESQMDVIRRWIDESDVYLLILGGRYGSIEPKTQLSYTELEFDYAVATAKPLFAVIINPETREARVRDRGSEVIETMNSAKLAAFESKVRQQMCAFFDDEKDIRLAILEKMLEFAERTDLKGWVPADAVQDVRPLHAEIEKLKSENFALSTALDQRRINDSVSSKNGGLTEKEFNKISTILKSRSAEYELQNEPKPKRFTVYETLIRIRDLLVRGTTIKPPVSGLTESLEINAFPTLIVHGLLVQTFFDDTVRYQMSEKGLAFLELMDAKTLAETETHKNDTSK